MFHTDVFLLNPDNADILQGTQRAPYSGKKMSRALKLILVIMMTFYMALTFLGLVWMVSALVDWAALNQDGIITEGRLIDRDVTLSRMERPARTISTYYLTYEYTTSDGQTLEGESQVTEEAYQSYRYNSPVQVLYLKDTPAVSRLAEENAFEFPRVVVFIGGINGLMAFFTVWLLWRDMRQQRRYKRDGRIMQGYVVAPKLVVGEVQGKPITNLYLNYRIVSPITGEEIHRLKQQRRDDLTEADLPREGSRLAVLYVNDRLFTVL